MKKTVKFSKLFIPCTIFSALLMVFSVVGLSYRKINFGLDFRSGFIEKVRIAPVAFTLSYKGTKTVTVSLSSAGIDITSTSISDNGETRSFPYSKYKDIASFMEELKDFEGLKITLMDGVSPDIPFEGFFVDSQVLPRLTSTPYKVHYTPKDSKLVSTDEVRRALEVASLPSDAVQQVGKEGDNVFQIRLPDSLVEDNLKGEALNEEISEKIESSEGVESVKDSKDDFEVKREMDVSVEDGRGSDEVEAFSTSESKQTKEQTDVSDGNEGLVAEASQNNEDYPDGESAKLEEKDGESKSEQDQDIAEKKDNANMQLHLLITEALSNAFGEDSIVVISTDFVGSRFSASLARQAVTLVLGALVLIFLYAMFRFRWDFALGGILALLHDTLAIFAFIVWTQMEFNSTSIAAVLTIIGYSINDTVVIFDRIRENITLHPKNNCTDILNISLSEVLGRTMITTLTTMVAALSLYIFTTGSMKDFAMCLIVGMLSGTYSSIYIASACINFFSRKKRGEEIFVAKANPQGISI